MRNVSMYIVVIVLQICLGIQMLETSAGALTSKPKEVFSKDIERIAPEPHDEEYLLFNINFLHFSPGMEQFEPLSEGSVLHSEDLYKIIFTPIVDCYVYIFQFDSANKIYQLFPMESFGGVMVNNFNPVEKEQTYYIPEKGKSFKLDEQTGIEKIYFLASKQRDIELEEQYQRVVEEQQRSRSELEEQLEHIDQLLNHAMKTQGALVSPENAKELTWEEDGRAFSVFQKRLENLCDGCVYVLTFAHK